MGFFLAKLVHLGSYDKKQYSIDWKRVLNSIIISKIYCVALVSHHIMDSCWRDISSQPAAAFL